jgi:hypothetical protein
VETPIVSFHRLLQQGLACGEPTLTWYLAHRRGELFADSTETACHIGPGWMETGQEPLTSVDRSVDRTQALGNKGGG